MTPTTATSKAVNVLCPTVKSVLAQLHRDGPWLAGGAARKLFFHQPLGGSDLDIFCKNLEQMVTFKVWLIENKARAIANTANNTTYQLGPVTVQLIDGKQYADHHALLDSFDFNLCQFVYNGEWFVHTEAAMNDYTLRQLTVNKITLPLYSMARVMKYLGQGFLPGHDVLMRLAEAAQTELKSKGEGGSVGA